MKKKDNLYIAALKVLEKHIVDGITMGDLKKEMGKEWSDIVNKADALASLKILLKDKAPGRGERYYLIPDGSLNLLEYTELEEARKSSKQALVCAIVAMVISAVLAIASIWQGNSPIQINDDQFKIIKQINNKLGK